MNVSCFRKRKLLKKGTIDMNRVTMCFEMALCMVSQFAFCRNWSAGDTSAAEGKIVAEYEGDKIIRLLAKPVGGETLVLESNDTLQFAANAVIASGSDGIFRLEAPVDAVGDLRIANGDAPLSSVSDFLPASEASAVLIGVGTLSDYSVSEVAYNPLGLSCCWIGSDTGADVFFVEQGDGACAGDAGADYAYHMSFQVQGKDSVARCVAVELRQRSNGEVVAWTPWAAHSTTADYGKDFRSLSLPVGNYHDISCIATWREGYGLAKLLLEKAGGSSNTVCVTKSMSVGGTLVVDYHTTLVADGPAALVSDGRWPVNFRNEGEIVVRNPALPGIVLTGDWTPGYFGGFKVLGDTGSPSETKEIAIGDWPSVEATEIASGVHVSSITNFTANAAPDGWLGFTGPMNCEFLRQTSPTSVVCQFQGLNNQYIKCVIYEVDQIGSKLYGKVLRACYTEYTNAEEARQSYPCDMIWGTRTVYPGTVATKASPGGYNVKDLVAHLDGVNVHAACFGGSVLSPNREYRHLQQAVLRGSVTDRVLARFTATYALPCPVVQTNAVLANENNVEFNTWGRFVYRVENGGEIVCNGSWKWLPACRLDVAGGSFRLVGENPMAAYSYNGIAYLNNVTFSNGGTVGGFAPNAGYWSDSSWTVCGTEPATISDGLILSGNPDIGSSNRLLTFDVTDVTGDAAADLTIARQIYYWYWNNIQIVKAGDGTLLQTAVNSANLHPIVVGGGTWKLGAAGCVSSDTDFILDGTTLAVAEGISIAMGDLTCQDGKTSSVRLERDAELSVGELSMGGASRLAITAEPTARIRIVNVADPSVLAKIRLNGKRVVRGEDGYLSENVGFVLLVR